MFLQQNDLTKVVLYIIISVLQQQSQKSNTEHVQNVTSIPRWYMSENILFIRGGEEEQIKFGEDNFKFLLSY